MTSPGAFEYRHRVTYADCTLGNHVYYSRYFEMLEAARGALFRSAGHHLVKLQTEDFIFPVIGLRADYRRAARYDDELEIRLWLSVLNPLRLVFGYHLRLADGAPVLEAETSHVCTSTSEKPRRMPKELVSALSPFLLTQ